MSVLFEKYQANVAVRAAAALIHGKLPSGYYEVIVQLARSTREHSQTFKDLVAATAYLESQKAGADLITIAGIRHNGKLIRKPVAVWCAAGHTTHAKAGRI